MCIMNYFVGILDSFNINISKKGKIKNNAYIVNDIWRPFGDSKSSTVIIFEAIPPILEKRLHNEIAVLFNSVLKISAASVPIAAKPILKKNITRVEFIRI